MRLHPDPVLDPRPLRTRSSGCARSMSEDEDGPLAWSGLGRIDERRHSFFASQFN